jgi:hypothetical protein
MNAAIQSFDYAGTRRGNFVFSPVRARNRAKSFELVPGDRAGIPMGMKNAPLVLSDIEFCGWLEQAAAGATIEYHRGFLALDCVPQTVRMSASERIELIHLARCAFQAAEKGFVHLVQRRNSENNFNYFAIARPRPKNAVCPATLIVRTQGEG